VTVFVLALAGQARAEYVDWSQYLEDKPTRVIKSEPAPVAQRAGKGKRAKKAAAKKSTTKARKAKRGGKAKKARRR
jgi:hypothetical protein